MIHFLLSGSLLICFLCTHIDCLINLKLNLNGKMYAFFPLRAISAIVKRMCLCQKQYWKAIFCLFFPVAHEARILVLGMCSA